MIDLPGLRIDAVYGVPFAQRQIQIAFGIEIERARTVERRSRQRRAVGRRFLLAGSGVGVDHSALQIDSPDAIIPDIAHQQLALRIEGDAVRLPELRFGRRSAVAAEAWRSGSGDRRDDLGLAVDAPDDVILHFDEEHVPGFIEANFVGLVERRLQGWPAIARVALGSGPRDSG